MGRCLLPATVSTAVSNMRCVDQLNPPSEAEVRRETAVGQIPTPTDGSFGTVAGGAVGEVAFAAVCLALVQAAAAAPADRRQTGEQERKRRRLRDGGNGQASGQRVRGDVAEKDIAEGAALPGVDGA